MSLKIGSLFSGYGGLDQAVARALDAEVAWHCEWDDAPSKILAHHYPDAPNFRDVTVIDWAKVPPVNVITGGYPCQPFSTAGHRKGTHDERHLWPHVLTAIRVLRPRFAFLENVSGHRTLGFGTVLSDLAEIGWDAQWTTLRASDVGAPHHRERLFILAYPNSERPQAERLTRRPAEEVAWDNDLLDLLAGLSGAADLSNEVVAQWNKSGQRVLTWALITGMTPPLPTVEQVTYRDPELWGTAFPEVKPVTNPEFVEWLMGLRPGWVTDPAIGLTRAQQLKALGNGVVPQQAGFALTRLLEQNIN